MAPPRVVRPAWKQCDDREVLEACLRGDQVAWAELVTRYSRLVYSIPRRYGLDRQASEDVYQEVFAILVRQLPSIRRRTALPKWFMTTTHRVCTAYFKQAQRTLDEPDGRVEPPAPPAELAVELERRHFVRQALRRLGGRCRDLLVALYSDQGPHGYEDVARKLDIPEGSIGPTRARCLAKLATLLDAMYQDDVDVHMSVDAGYEEQPRHH